MVTTVSRAGFLAMKMQAYCLLIVVGLGLGDPEHGKTFHKWGTTLAEASERLGVPPERLVYLVDQPAPGDKRVTGRATREEDRQGARRVRQAGGTGRRRVRHAHRPRQLRRPRAEVQPAGTRHGGRPISTRSSEAADQAGRVRQHLERERPVRRGAVGARAARSSPPRATAPSSSPRSSAASSSTRSRPRRPTRTRTSASACSRRSCSPRPK